MRSVQAAFEMYVKLNKKVQPEVLMSVQTIDDPARLSDTIVAQPAHLKLADRQELLEMDDAVEAPRAAARADAGRDRDSPGGEEDPLARQEADGEDAEGILPERADAGDPEGAGWRRARRVQERDPGDRRDAQDQADEQGGHRQGQEGAQEAQDDAPDERRGDRRAQLHRLDPRAALVRQDRRDATTSTRPRRSSTRTTTACKKIKERILEYLAVQALDEEAQGPGALLRRPARRRQDEPRARASRGRRAASSCACRSAACATRPRSAATGARTSARCRASSSSR